MGVCSQGDGETRADLQAMSVEQTSLLISDRVEGGAEEEERKVDFSARLRRSS